MRYAWSIVSLSNQAAGKNSPRLRASQKLSISAASSTVMHLPLRFRHNLHDQRYSRQQSTHSERARSAVAFQRPSGFSRDNSRAFAIGFDGIAAQMHGMVITAQPRLELVIVV